MERGLADLLGSWQPPRHLRSEPEQTLNFADLWPFRRKRDPNSDVPAVLQQLTQEIFRLNGRVTDLENVQLKRELEWSETKDQILRHLKRAGAIKQHIDERTSEEPTATRPAPAVVLAAKFPRTQQGG